MCYQNHARDFDTEKLNHVTTITLQANGSVRLSIEGNYGATTIVAGIPFVDSFGTGYIKVSYVLGMEADLSHNGLKYSVVKYDEALRFQTTDIGANSVRIDGIGYMLPSNYAIPSEIGGKAIAEIGDSAFMGQLNLESVTIPYSVTSIGRSAFSGLDVVSINFESGSLLKSIGASAFFGQYWLTGIEIPSTVNSIGDYAFSDCVSLTTVIMPEGGIKRIGEGAFTGCTSYRDIQLPVSVESIGKDAFKDTALWNFARDNSQINVPSGRNFWTVGVKGDSINGVSFPSGTKGIADGAFENVNGIRSVTFPSSMQHVGNFAFSGSDIKSVKLSSHIKTVGAGAFRGCASLERVELAQYISNGIPILGSEAFDACPNLTAIYASDSASVETLKAMDGWNHYAGLLTHDGLTYRLIQGGYSVSGILEPLAEVVIPLTYNGLPVVRIGDDAFSNNVDITKVTIPDSVTYIGYAAFSYCTSLKEMTIPSSVKFIYLSAFRGCNELTVTIQGTTLLSENNYLGGIDYNLEDVKSIVVPANSVNAYKTAWPEVADKITYEGEAEYLAGFNITEEGTLTSYTGVSTTVNLPDTVTAIGDSAFARNLNLKSIYIPSSVNTIGDYAFNTCIGLEEVSFALDSNLTSIGGWAFYDCRSLESVIIPDGVNSIGSFAFASCDSLTEAELPESLESIPQSLFWTSESLQNIYIPGNVTSMGNYAFSFCYGLEAVTFSGDSSLMSIGDYAFAESESLEEVTLPYGLNEIGNNAFYNSGALRNSSLKKVLIPATVTSIGTNAFMGCNNLTVTMESLTPPVQDLSFSGIKEIIVPAAALSAYKAAWPSVTDKIVSDNPDPIDLYDQFAFDGWKFELTLGGNPGRGLWCGADQYYNKLLNKFNGDIERMKSGCVVRIYVYRNNSVLFTFDLDWDYNSGLSSKLSLSLNDLYREYEKAGFTPVSTDRAAVQAVGLNGNISSGVSALFV